MPAGYLYVLSHPSDPNLYKVGQSTRHPSKRLAEHNSRIEEYTGQIVKETGQKWELKTFIAVPDVHWAEGAFWSATGLVDMPYRGGIEIWRLDWKVVQTGLKAAENAGVRPPKPVPDWVYAYRAWMNKRLEGRGISLLGHVRSKYGKSNFRCDNGHEWRTTPNDVAEGAGCPECGVGERTPEEVRQSTNVGVICLLTHPGRPEVVRFGVTSIPVEVCTREDFWGEWQVHRYRNVEDLELADRRIWDLLGHPQTANRELSIDLKKAEEAFRQLHYEIVSEIASVERAKDVAEPNQPSEAKDGLDPS